MMEVAIEVDLPVDEAGMLDRQCPNCEKGFKIHGDTYEEGLYLNIRCPYCHWVDEFDEFTSEQQVAYAKAAMMGGEGAHLVEDVLKNTLGDLFSDLTVDSVDQSIPSPFFESETTPRSCDDCDFRYELLLGESAGMCPVCRE